MTFLFPRLYTFLCFPSFYSENHVLHGSGLWAGGQADVYMSPVSCHLQGQQWTWLDGATYIYRTMSGKSVGGNKYNAEMNAVNSKFYCISCQIAAPSLSHEEQRCILTPLCSISHQQLFFPTRQRPCRRHLPTILQSLPYHRTSGSVINIFFKSTHFFLSFLLIFNNSFLN